MNPITSRFSAPSTAIALNNTAPAVTGGDPGVFWRGIDGKVYVSGSNGTNEAGTWDSGTQTYWSSRGFREIDDPNPIVSVPSEAGTLAPIDTGASTGTGIGTGSGDEAPVLDEDQLRTLDALIASLATTREQARSKADTTRKTRKAEKEGEKEREEKKYEGNKLSTLQDFSTALTDTNLNTRNTLENLMSSLSTLGLGGSRALTRQLLDAANISNRKANATQAQDTMNLDNAWNEYFGGYEDDVAKIEDQYDYDVGEADREYYQGKQNTLYKKADVYGDAEMAEKRREMMREGDSLNSMITGSTFLNPRYTGKARAMADTELGDYTQDVARYDTTGIKDANASPLTPVSSDGMNKPGNLAVRAIAVNDKDLGIKKKSENDLGYGV